MILNTLKASLNDYLCTYLNLNLDVYMTNNSTIRVKERLDVPDSTNRRGTTDITQPLDYATRGLESEIIENRPRKAPILNSLIQKLLR